MANYTENLDLKLPERPDRFNINDFNENWQKVDKIPTMLDSKVAAAEEAAQTANDAAMKANSIANNISTTYVNLAPQFSDAIGVSAKVTNTSLSSVNLTNMKTTAAALESGKYFVYLNMTVDTAYDDTTYVMPQLRSNNKYQTDISNDSEIIHNNHYLSNGTTFEIASILDIDTAGNFRLSAILRNIEVGTTTVFTFNSAVIVKLNDDVTDYNDFKSFMINSIKTYGTEQDSYTQVKVLQFMTAAQMKQIGAAADTPQLIARVETLENEFSAAKIVDYWGNSLTAGNQDGTGVTRATVLQELLGESWQVNNYGNGGEQSNTIACRHGGMHLIAQPPFTIPADTTAVSVEITDNIGNAVNLRTSIMSETTLNSVNPCYINGVKGKLSQGDTFATSPFKFTRETAGDQVAVTRPTTIITKAMQKLNDKSHVLIIWLGENGGWKVDDKEDIPTLIRQIKSMIQLHNSEKYLVMSMTANNRQPVNTELEKEFGVKFVDARRYLIDYGLEDAGLTATDEDTTLIAADKMPKSLLVTTDNTHFNKYGYTVIAKLEYKCGQELGYW